MNIWEARNKQLHETDRIKDLEGKKEIMEAIEAEYELGLRYLPAYGFSYLFKKKLDKRLNENM